MQTTRTVTIVGAGVAGLTIGYRLAREGYRVTVIEKYDVVGGLARTFHYGDFHFDVGPHRFHTENARVAGFIREILKEEAIEIPRKSGARMFNRFHEWPLRPGILMAMPITLMFKGARDLLFKEKLPGDSFEADVVNKYGRTLYDIFFEPYTRKFLFYSPSELHRDWARAGVNRAVIDKRAHSDNLWSLLKNTLMPKPVETMFLYPPHGVGRFSDLLAEGIVALGGRILINTPVAEVEENGTRIVAVRTANERIACENIVWTAPLTTLNRLLKIEGVELEYLSTIFYNLEIGKPPKMDYQWTYFGGDEIFSRVDIPRGVSAFHDAPRQERIVRGVHLPRGGRAVAAPRTLHRADHCRSRADARDRCGVGCRARAHRAAAVHLPDLQAELSGRADA